MKGTHSGPMERPSRLLVVMAHPRDVDHIGTTVAGWVEQGTQAWLVSCTSGDGHSHDAGADPLAVAAAQEAQLRETAARLGCASVTFLHRPQGAVANDTSAGSTCSGASTSSASTCDRKSYPGTEPSAWRSLSSVGRN